ncbi:MAG: hypothetical protein OXG15_07130, partial [Gammaproteobacteria bacterium]|nr:hypothetical protein [Gammaproteobacteria bacterium]
EELAIEYVSLENQGKKHFRLDIQSGTKVPAVGGSFCLLQRGPCEPLLNRFLIHAEVLAPEGFLALLVTETTCVASQVPAIYSDKVIKIQEFD